MGTWERRSPREERVIDVWSYWSRLQVELQKSCKAGTELRSLTGAVNDIHDTLGGVISESSLSVAYIHSLNTCCSPPIYHLTHPHYPPPEPQDSPINPHRLPYLLSRSSKPNFTAPNPPSRAMSAKGMRLRELSPSMLSSVRSVHQGACPKTNSENGWNCEEENEEVFGSASAEVDDDDSRSICTNVLHELERVEEEDEVQMVQQEKEQAPRGTRRMELGRPKTLDRAYDLGGIPLIRRGR